MTADGLQPDDLRALPRRWEDPWCSPFAVDREHHQVLEGTLGPTSFGPLTDRLREHALVPAPVHGVPRATACA